MSTVVLNSIISTINDFLNLQSKRKNRYVSLSRRLKSNEDILFFDESIQDMKKNNLKEKDIVLPSNEVIKVRLK